MAFQFVNVTPENTEQDADTRRRIRSQAMRDFRRRQRQPRTPEADPLSVESPPRSSNSSSRRRSRRREGSTQSLPLDLEAQRRPGRSTPDDLPSLDDSQPPKARPHARTAVSDDPASRVTRSRHHQDRRQPGTFSTFSVQMNSKQNAARGSDLIEPPDELESMLNGCDRYEQWLLENVESFQRSALPPPPKNSTASKMLLLSAMSLKSAGHLEALGSEESGLDCRLIKTKVLSSINQRLNEPVQALEDITLGSLGCLASYEISRYSTEAAMHLSGIRQIIHIRGGLSGIDGEDDLCMFLEMLDLIHAIAFAQKPFFTEPDGSRPCSGRGTPQASSHDTSEITQMTLEHIGNFIMSVPHLSDQELLPDASPPEPAITPSSLERGLQEWYEFFVQAAQSIEPSYGGTLSRACHAAASLHLLTSSAVTPHPTAVQVQTDGLFQAMMAVPENAWDAFERLHLRILLTALATASSSAQKRWYSVHLSRRLYHIGKDDWSQAKAMILGYIDMQSASRRPRTEAVRALANDIEIVVDPSEAPDNNVSTYH